MDDDDARSGALIEHVCLTLHVSDRSLMEIGTPQVLTDSSGSRLVFPYTQRANALAASCTVVYDRPAPDPAFGGSH